MYIYLLLIVIYLEYFFITVDIYYLNWINYNNCNINGYFHKNFFIKSYI